MTASHQQSYSSNAGDRARWREQLSMDDFKIACHSRDSSKFTCAVLCSGGLICTQAAVRSGFQVIWGTEICPQHPDYGGKCNCGSNDQQRMWTDWTGTPCLGNTFTEPQKYNAAETPDYLTSGFPCPNYSRLTFRQSHRR